MRLATLVLLLWGFLSVPAALAQMPGDCQLGTAEADLNLADVEARLFTTGSLFFGNTTVAGDGYIAPKGSGRAPMFAAGVWIGGLIDGDLRVAGATYADYEFWPGPLEPGATLPNPDDCSAFDRIFVVDAFDIQRYDATGVASDDLAAWPVELGAPVVDGDGDPDNYNLEGGDRPEVYGHQTAFWVMNDVGNEHRTTLTEPIGLEVRVTAFASAEGLLDRQTFYRYELVNRNDQPFEAARFGFFADPDLGDPSDDYVGSDSTRGMAFVYNADNDDQGGLGGGYGTMPPAFGYDLLSGAEVAMYFPNTTGDDPTSDPRDGDEIYNFLNGLWRDGTPVTEGGNGFMTSGPVTQWAYPGDPVTEQFWSEVNIDGMGADNPPGDRRNLVVSEAFTLAPGESRTFDLALLFAQGDDNLDSVTELRGASDNVQFRYDGSTLFVPGFDPPAPGGIATPEPVAPAEGAFFDDEAVLEWTPVPGAESYRVEVATGPDFADREVFYAAEPSFTFEGVSNAVIDYYWQVQAVADQLVTSVFSESRSFRFYRYESDDFGRGTGVIETAYPGADVCEDSDDPGCAEGYPGNTVWLDPNSTGDYVLTTPDNDFSELFRNIEVAVPDDFEIRFTDACATPGACLGVYASVLPGGSDLITSVPFELWNVGRLADDVPGDDVRMIPLLRALEGAAPTAAWADGFPAEQLVFVGDDALTLPVTQRVAGVMPDRPDGYALFEAAANGFGGPGATYDPAADGDEQVDPGPDEGSNCRTQSFYADFCYRGGSNRLVAPIGGLEGFVFADLAGDGTTPPAGTTIRFDSNDRFAVDAEDDGPVAPQAFRLGAAFPNPFAATATVPFEVEQAGAVRLSVFDVLGRRVATLVDGDVAAGPQRATLDGSRLATGVYFVVLEADGQRQATKVVVVR
jgi:hypothetical protein